jgi:hypothetical protein
MTTTRLAASGVLVALCSWPAATRAQQAFTLLDAQPLESVETVKNAPFSADAVTEFTQILSDGNRIERSFRTSIARDSRGRTRREQEIALLGPLAQLNDTAPRVVTIIDPEADVHYTLDERRKSAFRNRAAVHIQVSPEHLTKVHDAGVLATAAANIDIQPFIGPDQVGAGWVAQGGGAIAFTAIAGQAGGGAPIEAAIPAPNVHVQSLGTSQIEGVTAEGTRSTMTIPAGAVGNVGPIDVVTERWFSKDLQMAVQIARRDPRTGDTVYRLTNIVRAEPPADLFVVPPDYQIQDPEKMFKKLREHPTTEQPK